MEKCKHGDTHHFDIGIEQFYCVYDADFKSQGYWYAPADSCDATVFGFDIDRGFKTKEKCEEHIKACVKGTCKRLLRGIGKKMISARGGFNKKV